MVQWLRIYLPMQGTRVQCLVWEGPRSMGANKSVHHNTEAQAPRAHGLQQEKPLEKWQ